MPDSDRSSCIVEEPDDLRPDPVLALAGAEDRPADLDLAHRDRDQSGGVVDHELDLRHPERRRCGLPAKITSAI